MSSIRWFFRDPWRKLSSLLIAATVWVITYNQITSGIEVSLRVRAQQGKPVLPLAGAIYLQNQIDSPARPGEGPTLGRLLEINDHPVDTVTSIKLRIEGANENLATLGSLPSAWFQPGDLSSYPRDGESRIVVMVDPENPTRFGFYPAGRRLSVHFLGLVLTDGRELAIDELKLVYREMEPLSLSIDLRQVVRLAPYLAESYEIRDLEPKSLELLVPKGYSPPEGWERKMFDPWEYPGPALESTQMLPVRTDARRLPIVIQDPRGIEPTSLRIHLQLTKKKKEKQPEWKKVDAGTFDVLYDFSYLPNEIAQQLLQQVQPLESTQVALTIEYVEDPEWDTEKKERNLKRIQDLKRLIDVRLDLSGWLLRDESQAIVYDESGKLPKLKEDSSYAVPPTWEVTRRDIYTGWPESWTETIGGVAYQPKLTFTPPKIPFGKIK